MKISPLAALCALLFLVSSAHAQKVFWASSPALPGDTVMLAGDDLQSVTEISLARMSDTPGLDMENRQSIKPLQVTPRSLKFVIPATYKMGVYAGRLVTGGKWSETVLVNAPEVWWLQGDGGNFASPGSTLRVFGNSLNFGGQSQIELKAANGSRTLLKAAHADAYSLSAMLPATLNAGSYGVFVSNGLGSTWDPAGALEVKNSDAWPPQIFNVMDFYGAEADKEIARTLSKFSPLVDRTEAINAALKKATDNGGGIVFLPEGKYAYQGELKMPPRTVLKGEGMGQTVLRFGKGGFALDGGSDARRLDNEDEKAPPNLISGSAFGISDLSLYMPRVYQTGISTGDDFWMQRTRIRVDRYWIRDGQREHETTLRMGNNCRVTDCDILSQGVAIAFNPGNNELIARNTIYAGKSNIALERCDGAIIEDNQFISLDPTAYINLSGEGRNVYYARNKHSSFFVHQSDFSFTFDGQGSAYIGKVAAVDGTNVTLAADPKYPDWAKENHPLWRRCVVAIMQGKGTGQYRFVTANAGRNWQVDRPFDVAPDDTSTISIFPFRGRALVVGNRFEDANWVNMGYGSSLEVICANNQLYRCAALLNYGLREVAGVHASWFVQYLDNEVYEGNTLVEINSDGRHPELLDGTVTRFCINRRTHLHADNSGNINVGGAATDVIFEGCTLDNARSEIKVGKETFGVLLRNNKFSGAPRYGGEGLPNTVVLPVPQK